VALVAAGADVHATSKAGFTPLLFAVRGGHTDAVRALVTRGANVNDVAPDGTSALNMAVVNGYYEVAALLAEQHADPNLPDARGSALHTLAWHRRPGSDGGTGLGRRSYGPPVQTGDVTALELARLLLEHGANPNATIRLPSDRIPREGNMPNPPLITMGRHIITYDGATPFYVAARNGDPAYMRLLAEHGADPKRPNAAGVTPLIAAAGLDTWEGEVPGPFAGTPEAERLEAVTLALSLGNDINAATAFGDYTIEGDPQYTLIYPPANFNELSAIVKGGDPRWGGCTALHASIIANQPSITQFLVDNGATLDVKNRAGWTPLMMSRGIFLANGSREYPAAEAILIRAMTARGLPIPPAPPRATTAEAAGGR
jgi:ankyrin repeat protein